MLIYRVGFDFDGSLRLQPRLRDSLDRVLNLRPCGEAVRLWTGEPEAVALQEVINGCRREHPEPWLSFLGSGDYHHVCLFLLKTLPAPEPVSLVVIDNHPDWFREEPPYHCGNWVASAVRLPHLKQVILVGQASSDLRGLHFGRAPQAELGSGRLSIFPLRRRHSSVPFRRLGAVHGVAGVERRWWGSRISFDCLDAVGREAFFQSLAGRLAGERVYLSLDKDCLAPSELRTDWEQGGLSRIEFLRGVSILAASCRLVGVDVCGEPARTPLKGWWKRLDARRFSADAGAARRQAPLHEELNLSLLNALDPRGDRRIAPEAPL